MKYRIFLGFICTLFFTSLGTAAYSQEVSLGQKAEQVVSIQIDENGSAKILHEIKNNQFSQQIPLIEGNRTNLMVTDYEENQIQFGNVGGEILLIFPSSVDSKISYNLFEVVSKDNDGVWIWDFEYPASSKFFFPNDVNMVFINERPVNLAESSGINCHGCNATFQYFLDEPIDLFEITKSNEKYLIQTQTIRGIDSMDFDESSNILTFSIKENDKFTTIYVPKNLIKDPVDVYLDKETIFFHEFLNNETHIGINFKPLTSGIVQIGTQGSSIFNENIEPVDEPPWEIIIPAIIGSLAAAGIFFFFLKKKEKPRNEEN